jgi:hypothetical protein
MNPIYDIKIDNDSTIFYLATVSANNTGLYKVLPDGTQSLIYPHARWCNYFDYENGILYMSDSTKIYTSSDKTTFPTTLKDFGTTQVYGVTASKDGTYIYATTYISGNKLYKSIDSGANFTLVGSTSSPSRFDFIEINEGVNSENVKYYYENGRMNFVSGGIRMPSGYHATDASDIVTYADVIAAQSESGDLTGITTALYSGLSGGATSGNPSLSLSLGNLSAVSPASLSATDRLPLFDASTGTTKYITALDAKTSYFTGTTGVTSVAAGNGMNFTTITGTGTVTLRTPTVTLGETTTNLADGSGHTHAIDLGTFELEDLGDITAPVTTNTYLKATVSGGVVSYGWVAGTGASGVTSLTTTTTGGIYNLGTAADPSIVFNIYGLATTVTPTLSDWLPFADNSSSSTPKLNEKMTLQTLKTTLSAGLNVIFGDDSVQNVTRLIVDGTGISALTGTTGDATLTIDGGSGGDEGFQTLAETGSVNWSWLTSKNAQIPDVDGNITLSFTNQTDGQEAELWVLPDATVDYVLTFSGAGIYLANRTDGSFNIEHGTHMYCFTLKYNGTITRIDYASYLPKD